MAGAPGIRGYAEMASRLLLLSLVLIVPVLLFGKLIVLFDVAELALVAPLVTIGIIALLTSAWFSRSVAGTICRVMIETLHDPFGRGAEHLQRLRQR